MVFLPLALLRDQEMWNWPLELMWIPAQNSTQAQMTKLNSQLEPWIAVPTYLALVTTDQQTLDLAALRQLVTGLGSRLSEYLRCY